MEQDSDTNIPVSDAELSCNTPTTGYYEPDFYLELAPPLYSYIQDDLSYMKKPVHPYDKKTSLQHFHLPEPGRPGTAGARGGGRPASRPGMQTLVEQLAHRSLYSSRSHSPGSAASGDEPIELAHYPDAKVPDPSEPAAIERDDFPAPQYPYSDPERRRRRTASAEDAEAAEEPAEDDGDTKLERQEEALERLGSGLGGVFLAAARARRQQRRRRLTAPDPRSSSRVPAADRTPRAGLRYRDPAHASPSRLLLSRSAEEDLFYMRYHGWAARSLPSGYNVASALRPSPKPGYGLAPAGFPSSYVTGTRSTPQLIPEVRDLGFGSLPHRQLDGTRSEDSLGSFSDTERLVLGRPGWSGCDPASVSFSSQPAPPQTDPQSPFYRRSRQAPLYTIDPDSKYPVERLRLDRNRRLPDDVDKTQLERHLTERDFTATFRMSAAEFYRLPEWRRKKIKMAAHLY